MRESSPRSVATHYAACAALAFSAIGAPFVPEAIAFYAGIRYLRGFLYGTRQWRAPARVPLHLGRRGYCDATTRRRGAATWPIGITEEGQQVWLLREDLAQGCVHVGQDPGWHAAAVERLVFNACLNRMGALVVQDHEAPALLPSLIRIAAPFGRDAEVAAVDLADPLTAPLKVSHAAIAAALTGCGVSDAARAIHSALAPILTLIARRIDRDPFALFQAFIGRDFLQPLVDGRYEIDGIDVENAHLVDEPALREALSTLRAIPADEFVLAQKELTPYALELATTPGLSLTYGVDPCSTLAAQRLSWIRPSSLFTAAVAVEACSGAVDRLEAGSSPSTLIHLAYPNSSTSPAGAVEFLRSSARAGAVGSVAVTRVDDASNLASTLGACGLRFELRETTHGPRTFIESRLKDCRFDLYVLPFGFDSEANGSAEAGRRAGP